MLKINPVLSAVLVLVIASLACTSPTITISSPLTPDPNLISTSIAQTVVAALTLTTQPLFPSPTSLPTSTSTPEPPTLTPTATLSPTPVFTATPVVPQISVSVATNCRVGPGRVYDRVGALLVGEVAEIVGLNPTGDYFYIRNPDSDGFCWLWGNYATLSGNYSALPVYTPPPTPTPVPAFEVSFNGMETCVGWWPDLKFVNTGGISFRSISITVRDTVTDTVIALSADNFTDNNGCGGSNIKDTLNPEDKWVVSAPAFNYDPTGHKLRATVTACSNKGIGGTCVSQVIEFRP